jgi:hypothetical protein
MQLRKQKKQKTEIIFCPRFIFCPRQSIFNMNTETEKEKHTGERMNDIERLEKKLDLIIDALGLGKSPMMAPIQRKEFVAATVLKFKEKRRNNHEHDSQKSTR